ncbi:two pore domain potassium channel family protein [Flavobacterium salilacus subsp. salilacus]|uniref:potassium channel family protein n=1 Tax=Flavobacterium TaxID=237 RepID=UPI001074B0D2|nr:MULTISPECIES: potassium channel family protein [Flavobacterium]KAF2518595.1 two pore domain potassium channel family protein [Flavobacterium salilacus subsp. salilacus]MBE1613551.1 two pore domain potassium channel family protein [Flavobacterium sp. SaA2.13]NDI99227.1 two pore domain potassium channel family protein [Flavobacterium salilacus subsp. altitudinum]
MLFFKTILTFLRNKEYRDLLYTTAIVLFIGTIAYHFIEGWGFIDSLYFSVVTLTTIGFGDFAPQTDAGKLFTVLYIVMGIGVILTFINTLKNHYNESRESKKKK